MLRVIAHDRFAHHGHRSGYVQVLPHLAPEAEISLVHLPLPPRGFRAAIEWRRASDACAGAESELHVYPEQTLFPRRRPAPVVAVCHQPAHRYLGRKPRDILLRRALASSAALVSLGPQQARGLAAVNPNVEIVPHGVDTGWFSPLPDPVEDGSFLAIGGWLRDARFQADLVRLARNNRPVSEVGGAAPRLSDDEYRDVLRRCSAVLLWITDGVASNAVLEAASCGKAILGRLSADLEWYVSEANRDLLRLPPEEQLRAFADEWSRIGLANRVHVTDGYSWPAVAERLLSVARSHTETEARSRLI